MDINALTGRARLPVEFALTSPFNFVAADAPPFKVKVIRDLEEAMERATSDELADCDFTFGDIKELAMAELRSGEWGGPNFSVKINTIVRALDGLAPALRRRLPLEFKDFAGDIASDFTYIAVACDVGADSDSLFVRMYELYRLGYWPCGWVGPFEGGKLCAYSAVR